MNKFMQSVAGVLEVEEVDANTKFRESKGWCSLHAFGLLVLMENDWQAPITIEALKGMTTVGELYAEAFLAFAARIFKVERSILSLETRYEGIKEWDSVNHLRLVMEAEKYFQVAYPLERIPHLVRLGDFLV